MSIDTDELRESLRARAETSIAPADLLARVHARADRLARRRRMTIFVIAVVVAAFVASAPSVMRRQGAAPFPPAATVSLPPPSPTPTPSPTATVPTASAAFVPMPAVPQFPYTPSWEPSWSIGIDQFWYKVPAGEMYGRTYEGNDRQYLVMAMDAFVFDDHRMSVGSQQPITVAGRPGTLYVGESSLDGHMTTVTWRDRANRWWYVTGYDGTTEVEVGSFVNGLLDVPMPMHGAVTCTLAPKNLTLESVSDHDVIFSRSGQDSTRFWVQFEPVLTGIQVGPRRVMVGGRVGELLTDTVQKGQSGIRVVDPVAWPRMQLTVTVLSDSGHVSDEDLIAFAASVQIDPSVVGPTFRPQS